MNPSLKNRRGFTLIELLASIAVILILAAIVIISLQKFLDSSRHAKNASNLRQLWSTALLYAGDHGGRLPENMNGGPRSWHHQVVRWHKGLSIDETTELFSRHDPPRPKPRGFLEIFDSPLNPTVGNMAFGSGGWNNRETSSEVFGRRLASIDDPARSIALAPYYEAGDEKLLSGRHWRRPSGIDRVSWDDEDYATCALVDGSVTRVSRRSVEEGRYVLVYPGVDVSED